MTEHTDVDVVRDVLIALDNDAGGSQVSVAREALDRLTEEVKQSLYYRECRDKWREQAESLTTQLQQMKQERDEALRLPRALAYPDPLYVNPHRIVQEARQLLSTHEEE